MRISDWSSDVCSSDLAGRRRGRAAAREGRAAGPLVEGRRAAGDPRGAPRRLPQRPTRAGRPLRPVRPEERRGAEECVRTCSSRWEQYPSIKKLTDTSSEGVERMSEYHVSDKTN